MINSFGLYIDVLSDNVKRFIVESRKDYCEIFDSYVYDYIYAENEDEAIEMYKTLLIENGCDVEEVEEMEFRVEECGRV